ncbi:22164_t:CDS:2, partial [Gigaspora margarita]
SILKLNRSTITKTLQKSEQYLYLKEIFSAGIVFLDKLMKLKGHKFGNRLGIPKNNLKFNNKATSAPLETLADKRIKLKQFLSQYEFKNIYNTDKTRLFYWMLPNQTLVQQAVASKKIDKSGLTILLAMNATGSHKLQLLVIGKSRKSWSFNKIDRLQLPVMYEDNEHAWMKFNIWEKWLTFHNKDFHIQNKKVLLLVDSAKSYSIPKMPTSFDNIDDNRDQRLKDNELDSEYKNNENFISEDSENDEISNSR